MILPNDLDGELWLLTYDHFLGKEKDSQNDIENYLVFKIQAK